jgi:ferredoxin-NADP reductase
MTAIEMAASHRRRLEWQLAEVREIVVETPHIKTLLLHVADWRGHLPGQHVDIRLTAEDGYQAQRSYSISSPPGEALLALTVEHVENGEVSPYLVCDVRIGDQFEVRGPIGGHFVWTIDKGGPLCLIAGGSGIAPLMAMLRHRDRSNFRASASLLYSSRSLEEVVYRDELDTMARRDPTFRVAITLTRRQPRGWSGYCRRIDSAMIADVCPPPAKKPIVFVCGPTLFVENVSKHLVALRHDPPTIKTERFGPTGG